MKKDYIDFLYDKRSLIKIEICRLVEVCKQPRAQCCDDMDSQFEPKAELRIRRSQLESIDDIINEYIETRKRP